MKKILIFIILTLVSCSVKQTKQAQTYSPLKVDSLNDFFTRCEIDLNNAIKVILKEDIIKNLSHLQNMNNGGKKYYILEKENLTSMIKAVTTGVYTDFILLNKQGKIIYTMNNEEIFGKNVKTSLKSTVLNKCYENRNIKTYISDVSSLPGNNNKFSLTASSKVKGGKTMPGIFILQIDISKIEELINNNIEVIGKEGKYSIIKDRTKIHTSYYDFDKINTNISPDTKILNRFINSNGKNISYQHFTYSNLNWFLLSEY